MSRLALRWLLGACLLCLQAPLLAQDVIKIGILAYRPTAQANAQWKPLADALGQAIPGQTFVVETYGYQELQNAVAARQVDFVFTNPGDYILMARRSGLSAPLATLANKEHGEPVTSFGGVIFTRADRTDIRGLRDLRGKKIAATSTGSLGGYQMQAYLLTQSGFRLPDDIKLLPTGMPHDNVVEAVLSGRADAGFVRSGLLESMANEGKLNLAAITFVNRQELAGFPVAVSTRLYPEWPFASLPHIDKDLKRKVASFLLTLEENKALTQTLKIHGFDVPADYTPVEDLLRELRLPPYDVAPAFTLRDVLERYRWQVLAGLTLSGLLVMMGFKLLLANRRLREEKARVHEQTHELQESELRFRTVANYTHDWEYWLGPQNQIYYISPSCERITGYSREEFVADPGLLESIVHPDDRQHMLKHLQNADNNRTLEDFDFRVIRRDGSTCWIAHVCQPVYDDAGQYMGRRVANRDITDRKQAEDEIQEKNALLLSIINSSTDFIFAKDLQLRSFLCNRRYAEAVGKQPEQLYGKNDIENGWPEELVKGNPEKGIRGYETDDLAALRGETVHNDYDPATVNGELRIFDTIKLPIRDADGKIIGVLGVSRDITLQHQARETLVNAKETAEQSARAKSEFVANMSHEIRTPMNGIIGLTQLALNQKTSPEVRDYLQKIAGASHSLLSILNDILDFSKLEAGRMTIDHEAFDLDIVLDNVRNLFEDRAHAKHLEFGIEVEGEVPRDLVGDAMRIQQILANLLGNALKFTEHGKVAVTVALLENHQGKVRLRFCVSDTGIGISENDQKKLFQPFSQVDGSITRRFGGTGLGLSISQDLLQLMGSQFHIESRPGHGSTFCFELQLGIATMGEIRHTRHRNQPPSLMQQLSASGTGLKGARILVAEDNAINQQVVKEYLKLCGMEVLIADNGQQAIDLLHRETRRVDAVLMDVHMPVMDGLEATRLIRSDARYGGLPVIALTAGVTDVERANCVAVGMNDFVAKPIDPELLSQALMQWIRPAGQGTAAAGAMPDAGLDLPGFDCDNLLKMLGGNRTRVVELLRDFIADLSPTLAEIRQQAEAGNPTGARELAHRLKGAAGNVGAVELHAAAAQLEAGLKRGNYDPELMSLTEQCFGQATAAVAALTETGGQPTGDNANEGTGDHAALQAAAEALDHLLRENEFIDEAALAALARHLPAERQPDLARLRQLIGSIRYEEARVQLQSLTKPGA